MSYPNIPASRSTPFGLKQVPDYTQLREHAHRERSQAIGMALAFLWKRVRRGGSLGEQDARFWQA